MSGALMRIMQDTIDKEVAARVEKEVAEQVEKQCVLAEVRAKVETLVSLVQDGFLSTAEAAKRLSMTESEFLQQMKL